MNSMQLFLSCAILIDLCSRFTFAHQRHHHNDAHHHQHHHQHNHNHNHNHHHYESENEVPSFLFDRNLNSLKEQQRCATKEPSKSEMINIETKLEKFKKSVGKRGIDAAMDGTIDINVYWNTFTSTSGEGALSDDVIEKQIQILNDAFSGVPSSYDACGFSFDNSTFSFTPFRFNLVEISVHTDDTTFIVDRDANEEKRRELHQGNCSDLNIYSGVSDFGLLGFAHFPWDCEEFPLDDGVVVNYESLPEQAISAYNEGDTLIHEVGHWLGLFHTFQGGCLDRDYVVDTPAQSFPTFGCEADKDTCAGPGLDPIHNFMDYSDDCCMYRFSNGQIERMILQAGLFRALSANVTLPTVVPVTCSFPNDGFNYSSCNVENECWVGDGYCDSDELAGYDTDECNNDGGDCVCEFPDDGFNYTSCDVEKPCWIGDGWCDAYYFGEEYGSDQCNFDGGDCGAPCEYPDDGFDYSSCDAPTCWIGDGWCDGVYDTDECNRDGGDCNAFSTIWQTLLLLIQLPYAFFWYTILFFYCYCGGFFDTLFGGLSVFPFFI